jgi:hypothetical protein
VRAVTPELAAAITAPERTARAVLQVDWDADGFGGTGTIDDLSDKIGGARLDRTLQTDLPAEVQPVEGSAVASMTADLVVGDTTDEQAQAIRYYSRFNTTSPLYGKARIDRDVALSVEFATDLGPQTVPRMRGVTQALPVDVGAREAMLGALDLRQRLRAHLSLPAVVAQAPPGSAIPSARLQAPGLESTWIASYVCAQNGIYVSPPPRSSCRIWVPCHGSVFPMRADLVIGIGTADVTDNATSNTHRAINFQTGPYVLGTETVPTGYNLFLDLTSTRNDPVHPIVSPAGATKLRIEFWAKVTANSSHPPLWMQVRNASHGGDVQIDVRIAQTTTKLTVDYVSVANGALPTVVGPTAITDGAWHFYGVYLDSAAGNAVFRIDSTSTTVAFTPPASPVPWSTTDEAYDLICQAYEGVALTEIQVSAGGLSTDPWLNGIAWTAGAVIDRGYPLQGIADTSPQDSWQILTDLQAATLGAAWYDEDGILQVAMPGRLVSTQAQVVQRTLTSLTDIVDLAYDERDTATRNRVLASYQPIAVHVAEEMWRAPGTVYLPSSGITTLYATFSGPFITTPDLTIKANTAPDGSGTDVSAFIVVAAGSGSGALRGSFPTAQTAVYTLTNTWTTQVWLVDTNGASSVVATGDWVEQAIGTQIDISDIPAGQREQTLDLGPNPWRQDRSYAAGVAMALLCALRNGQQNLTRLVVPLDPRLQFYDRVNVQDQQGTGLNQDWWLTGMSEDYRNMLATLTARQAQNRFLAGPSGRAGVDIVG